MLKAFLNKPLKHRVLRGLFLAIFVGAALAWIPTPFYLEAPGRVENVGPMIDIQTETFPSSGSFLLPTVVAEPATLLYCFYGFLTPDAVLTRNAERAPQAQSPDSDNGQMAMSQYFSTLVALNAVGHDMRPEFRGLRILKVIPQSPNLGVLEEGDLLTSLSDQKLTSFADFKNHLNRAKAGQKLDSQVDRKGQILNLKLSVFRPDGKPRIGVRLMPEFQQTELPFKITFESGTTSGASGGLVFALEIYNRLTQPDITKGRTIAATGTLDVRGNVGPINGINFKLKGAQAAGCQIFLVPESNLSDITWQPDGMKVIPVRNFNDALNALNS